MGAEPAEHQRHAGHEDDGVAPPVVGIGVGVGRVAVPVAPAGRLVGQDRQRQRRGDRHERQQGEEHHAPRRRRARCRWPRPGRRARARPTRVENTANTRGRRPDGYERADGGVRHRGDHAGAHALQHPADDEHGHRRRGAADDEPDGEQGQAGGERQTGAPPVGSPAGEDDADQAAEEEPAEDPAVQAEAAEVVGHHRHHRGDGERLERHQGDRQHEGGGEPPTTGGPDPARRSDPTEVGRHGRRGRVGRAQGAGGHGRHRGRSTSCSIQAIPPDRTDWDRERRLPDVGTRGAPRPRGRAGAQPADRHRRVPLAGVGVDGGAARRQPLRAGAARRPAGARPRPRGGGAAGHGGRHRTAGGRAGAPAVRPGRGGRGGRGVSPSRWGTSWRTTACPTRRAWRRRGPSPA